MPSEKAKARIAKQETTRPDLGEGLSPPVQQGWLQSVLSGDNVKWIATSLVIPLCVWIWSEYDQAKHQASLIEEQTLADARQDVAQMTALLPGLSSVEPRERSISMVVLGQLVASRKAAPSLLSAYNEIKKQAEEDRQSDDPTIKAAAARTEASLLRGSDAGIRPSAPPTAFELASAVVVNTTQSPPISSVTSANFVFIQVYSELQRPAAQVLSSKLESDAIPVMGIENVVTTHGPEVLKFAQKGSIDIRYYFEGDKIAALSLVPLVSAAEPSYGTPTVRSLRNRSNGVKPGTIEIWFPCGPQHASCPAPGHI